MKKNKIFNKLTIWDKIFGNRINIDKTMGTLSQMAIEIRAVLFVIILINLINLFSTVNSSEKLDFFLKINWIGFLGIGFIISYNFFLYRKRRLFDYTFYKKDNEFTVKDLLLILELFFYPKRYKKVFKEVIENEFSEEKLKKYLDDKSLGIENIYYRIIEDEEIQNKILEKIPKKIENNGVDKKWKN